MPKNGKVNNDTRYKRSAATKSQTQEQEGNRDCLRPRFGDWVQYHAAGKHAKLTTMGYRCYDGHHVYLLMLIPIDCMLVYWLNVFFLLFSQF